MTTLSRCWSRDLVAAVDAPTPIPLGEFYNALTAAERRAWHCWAKTITIGDDGLDPAGVEQFLRSLEQ